MDEEVEENEDLRPDAVEAVGSTEHWPQGFARLTPAGMAQLFGEEEYGDSVSVTDEMIAATRQPTQEVPNPDEHVEETLTPQEMDQVVLNWDEMEDDHTQKQELSLEDQVEGLLAQLAESEAILQERGAEISRLRATLRTLKNDWAHDTLKMESQVRTIERQGYTIDGLRETGRYQRQEISRLRQDNRALQIRLTEHRRAQGDQPA